MDIGIFGGTFDPVHTGHIQSVQAVLKELKLDSILIMPNHLPYYKDRVQTSDNDRVAMLRLATKDYPELEISTLELERATYSYTYDNMLELSLSRPDDRLVFIMGADSFFKLPSWHRGLELVNVTNIAVIQRPGFDLTVANFPAEIQELLTKHLSTKSHLTAKSGSIFMVSNPKTDISSSELRAWLSQKDYSRATDTLNSAVLDYIIEHHLYSSYKALKK